MQAGAQAGAVPGAGGLNLDVLEPVCVLQAKVTQKPQNPLAESLGRWRRGGRAHRQAHVSGGLV